MTDPTVTDRRASLAELGAALRDASAALVATEVAADSLEEASAHARAITTLLESETRALTTLASVDDLGAGIRWFSPTVGPGNPMSPPITVESTAEGVVTRVTLDRRFEGPPGLVHGGVTGLLLDEVLGRAGTAIGRWGMTAYLNITYRRALPVDVELELSARVDRIEGRKTFTSGTIALASDPQVPLVEAEALFVEPRAETQAGYFRDLTDASGNPASARVGG